MRQFRCVYECWKVAVEIAKEQTVQLYCTVVTLSVCIQSTCTVQQRCTVLLYCTVVVLTVHYTGQMYCTAEVYSRAL